MRPIVSDGLCWRTLSWGCLLRHIDPEGLCWGTVCFSWRFVHFESAWSVLRSTEAECYQLGSWVWRPDWRINWSAEWAESPIPGTLFWSSYCTNVLSIQDSIIAMGKPWGERMSRKKKVLGLRWRGKFEWQKKRNYQFIMESSLFSQQRSPKHLHAHTESI